MDEGEINLKGRIERASALDAGFETACLDPSELDRLVGKLRRRIERTDDLMLGCGVAEACSACARKTGSCCFREMGEGYGVMQLFVNRLLGCELPKRPDFPGACFFVGEKGCKLKARHSFCLNYFCPELVHSLGQERVHQIQRQAGEQLLAGWELERRLSRCVTSDSIPKRL